MNRKGFTLVELLVAIVIVALISQIGVMAFNFFVGNGRESYYNALESSILLAGNDYYLDHRDELPLKDNVNEVSLNRLIEDKYLEEIKDSKGNACTSGVVYAYQENNQYVYEPCLICDDGYHSHGKYCMGEDINTINVNARTKESNQPRNVLLSYNSVEAVLRENVMVDLSINNASIDVSRYEVKNARTKENVLCQVVDNSCTAEIDKSGTYEVKAYTEENKLIATRIINIRIINQSDGYITLEANSGSIPYETESKVINITSHHGGTLTVTDDNNTVTCSASGTVVTCSNLSSLNAGTNIRITVTSGENDEYREASANYDLSIERAAGSFVCSNKIYDGKSQKGCTCSGGTLSGTVTGTEASTTVKTTYCTPDANHTINGSTEKQTLTWYINKKNLTITASKQTIKEGNSITTGVEEVTTSGLVSGDSLTAITLTGSRKKPGKGTITASDAKTSKGIDNYDVSYVKGELIIYIQKSTKITGASGGTVTFTDVNTIVKKPWIKDEKGTITYKHSETTVTCTITDIPKFVATTDTECATITGSLALDNENFYYNGSCYYKAGSSPRFESSQGWQCGTKTNPLDGNKMNHCSDNSDQCPAKDCWNAIKYSYNGGYKCKCWGKMKNWVYYDAAVYIRYY